ncbi:alpha/beta hydrolase [Pseudaminobacter salicylatoxidans]|uniref:alpha/beta hydrolase n=1 Tax=Pseudaminobacter salicylatoxidans TaxID=93369 RepID=UPI00031F8F68|nr:alpha/beta fold hydrolase [Pseudaminobacter salicylatoxidans]
MRRLGALCIAVAVMTGPAHAGEPLRENMSAAGFPATLTVPVGEGAAPTVLVIAGSGPTDRDGNSILGIKAGYLALLADDLAAGGVATLRYDKRGVAGSKSAEREDEFTIDSFVDDAADVFDWLAARPDIGPIMVLGHSEGGMIALELAKRRPSIAGLVLVATPGRRLADTLRDQLAATSGPLRATALEILARLEAGDDVADVPVPLLALFRPSIQPYLRSLFALATASALAELPLPVLVIGGGADLQVSRADFDALSTARENVESRWFARMNHVLVDAGPDFAGNVATYAEPARALPNGLADVISGFVLRAANRP